MDTGSCCKPNHKPVRPVIFLQIEFDFTLDDIARLELHILATDSVVLLWHDVQTYFTTMKGLWALVNTILSHRCLYSFRIIDIS